MSRFVAGVVVLVLAGIPAWAEDGKAEIKKGPGGLGTNTDLAKRLIEKFDSNKDGKLSPQERAKAQEEMLKNAGQAGGPAFQELLKKFDRDGDGKLNDKERMAAMEAAEKIRAQGGGRGPQVGAPPIVFAGNEIPAAVLEKFDTDGDGKLNDAEQAAAKKALSGKRERRKQADVIKEFDKDGDGKLNDAEKAAARAAAKERKKESE